MSGLGGGAADKRGNQYERWWTLRRLLELIDGSADRLRLEPPGAEGAEFWIEADGRRCYDQAKDVPSKGNGWTTLQLLDGPITKLRHQLDAGYEINLVLSTPATEFKQLVDFAVASKTPDELRTLLTKKQAESFRDVTRVLECDEAMARSYLRHISVTWWGRDALLDHVRTRTALVLAGDPKANVHHLEAFCESHLHQIVNEHDIWHFLDQLGVRPNLLAGDASVVRQLGQIGKMYVDSVRAVQTAQLVSRPDAADLAELLQDDSTPQVVIVDGVAGSGKSAVVAEAAAMLQDAGWLTTGLRMDRIPADALTSASLGRHLGLDDPLGLLIASAARRSPVLLVVDQLDAVSQFSGRLSQPFDAVLQMLDEVKLTGSAKVVLVVRTIDLDNDSRLGAMLQKDGSTARFRIGDFSTDQLTRGLAALDIEAHELDGQMRELLRVPLHFSVFAQLDPATRKQRFATLPQLYLSYTDQARRRLVERDPSYQWDDVVNRIVDYISTNETLAVPPLALAGLPSLSLAQLKSQGVLTEVDGHVGFFHETYFDFLFAASFMTKNEPLIDFIVGSGQQLFRRSQLRQVMVHIEGTTPRLFASTARSLLVDDRVRSHLKDVAISVVGLVGASASNWTALEDLILGDDWVGQRMRRAVAGPTWFDAVDAALRWDDLLDDPEHGEHTRTVLLDCAHARPARVAELFAPRLRSSGWGDAAADLLHRARSPELAPFAIDVLESGLLDSQLKSGGLDLWGLIEDVARSDATAAANVLEAALQRALDMACAAGQADPFKSADLDARSGGVDAVLEQLSTGAPAALLRATLPFVVSVACSTTVASGDPDRISRRWSYRHRGQQFSVEGALLQGLEKSFAALGPENDEMRQAVVTELEVSDVEVLRFLTCRAFTASSSLATDALIWLASDPSNLYLGWSDAPAWASRALIETASVNADSAALSSLEETLLTYWPAWELGIDGRHRRGYAQHQLLSAIPDDLRSDRARKRVGELDRRFGAAQAAMPPVMTADYVRSPIAPDAAPLMSDDNWLRAIHKYDSDESRWDGLRGVGNARELAQLLRPRAEAEPERFAALAMKFDQGTHAAYADAVIRGAGPSLQPATLGQLLTRLEVMFGEQIGRTVCWAISDRKGAVDNFTLAVLNRYSFDPDPESDRPRSSDDDLDGYDLDSVALNSTRGAAAQAYGHLLFSGDEHLDAIRPVVARLAADPVMAVRSSACMPVLALSNHDLPLAQNNAEVILGHSLIDIFDSSSTQELLTYASIWDPKRSQPLVQRALDGPERVSRRGGSIWAVLLNRSQLPDGIAAATDELPPGARIGAANTLAQWFEPNVDMLCSLFDDPDDRVTKEAAAFLSHLDDTPPRTIDRLLKRFVRSRSFADHIGDTARTLRRHPEVTDSTALEICRRSLDISEQRRELDSHHRSPVGTIGTVAVRSYRTCSESERGAWLDVIDQLCEQLVYGLEQQLDHTRSS